MKAYVFKVTRGSKQFNIAVEAESLDEARAAVESREPKGSVIKHDSTIDGGMDEYIGQESIDRIESKKYVQRELAASKKRRYAKIKEAVAVVS